MIMAAPEPSSVEQYEQSFLLETLNTSIEGSFGIGGGDRCIDNGLRTIAFPFGIFIDCWFWETIKSGAVAAGWAIDGICFESNTVYL